MTDRLYYTDSYATTFNAAIVERAPDGRRVVLDRSAFYPTSGGQPHDTGFLGDAAVVDVIDEGERVTHVLGQALAAGPGDRVTGHVDWDRRFHHMQQHTGQHLLSALIEARFGWATVSVAFGDDGNTLDLDCPAVTPADLARIEREANRLLAEDRPVTVSFEDAATAAGLRKATDRTGELRIVTIADLDRSACGGTHVRRTGEIGVILLRGVERMKGRVRLEFRCGLRAVERARRDQLALARLGAALSAGADDVAPLVEAKLAELKAMAGERKRLAEELAAFRVRALWDAATPGEDGVRRLVAEAATAEELRLLGQAASALPATLFVGTAGQPPTALVAASADSGIDAAARLKPALVSAGGRGGGSPRLAQGSVPDADALARVRSALA
ncbi:MAG: alanine--tRNA ligase-related protein [Gemmatimonadales bacterium]|nr:alanine--tRNA ligase-related protein [Gemmatimonadales bacterium]